MLEKKIITPDEVEELGCLCCVYKDNTNIYCQQELCCVLADGDKNMLTVDGEKYIIDGNKGKENKQMAEKISVTSKQLTNDPCEYCNDVHKTSDYCYEVNKCINASGEDNKFRLNNDKYCLVDENETDMVNHPKHYNDCSIECIDIMVMMFGAEYVAMHCVITAYKYMHRYKSKNGLEDLKKAEWYLTKHAELCGDYELRFYNNYNEMCNTLEKMLGEYEDGK